jgi:hypothetical protein
MSNSGFFKTRLAGGAIAPFRIVAHGAADHTVLQAAAATNALCGLTQQLGASAAGKQVDVFVHPGEHGQPEVEYGGIVTRGDPLTSDAAGKAIKAEAVAGSTVRIIGFADVSGVAGDIVAFQFAPGVIYAPAAA